MKLKRYLPQLYDDNAEMSVITQTEDIEFYNAHLNLLNNFKDNFLAIATEVGITYYEKLFGIVADTTTESLEFRRNRVLNRLLSHIPFTEKYLQEKLNIIIGENTNIDFTPNNHNNDYWYYEINYNNYTLDIYIAKPGRGWLKELEIFLKNTIPCNIDYEIHVYTATWKAVQEYFNTWQNVETSNDDWNEVLYGEWIN